MTQAAVAHGYSRAAFYLILANFSESGMLGLLDEARGRCGPKTLYPKALRHSMTEIAASSVVA